MFPNECRVLVVDDMAAMRLRVANQLTTIGFKQIEQAGNGQEAFDLLIKRKEENSPFELVISDWNMPVLAGIDLLQKVRAIDDFKNLPFLMVTAEGEKEQIIRAIKTGVSDYLIKPVNVDTLQQKLVTVWKKHNP